MLRPLLCVAEKSADKDLLLLAAKLERACGCSIAERAKIAQTWPLLNRCAISVSSIGASCGYIPR